MKVLLKRNLFLGGSRYRQDSLGVEIPDTVDGKKVVLLDAKKPHGADEIVLPRDVVLFDETKPRVILRGELLKGMEKPKPPQALSQMKLPETEEELLNKKR
jgi:hypothetical protein